MKQASKKDKKNKFIKFKPKRMNLELNAVVIIFSLILLYLIGVIATYLMQHNISTYRVTDGSIINDTSYNGLILREEVTYNSSESGYIQFYHSEGSKVSYDTVIYTLSSSNIDSTTTSTYEITSSEQKDIIGEIQSFNKSYSSNSFDSSYDLISDVNYILHSSENDEKLNELSNIDISTNDLSIYKTSDIGIIAYSIDGYESITSDNFTASDLDRTNYSYNKVSSEDNISSDTPIYKLINNETWSIIIEVAEEDIESYEELSTVTVKFLSDGETINANISLTEQEGITYGVLTFTTGMVRYISERFTDIELILDDLEGYKIPISSVISREFYRVPIDYVTKGGTSGSNGLLFVGEDNITEFEEIKIYYQDDDYVYLLKESIGENQTIMQTDTAELLLLSDIVELDGVYSVNKGYAEFKIVEILTSSSEYYIVNTSTSYSISNYDHIALYGNSVTEFAIIN